MSIVVSGALDGLLDYIAANVTTLHVCSGSEPTSRTAVLAQSIGNVAFGSGDVTKADHVVSTVVVGRKNTYAAKTGLSATAAGNTDHIALISATELLVVTNVPAPVARALSEPFDVTAWEHREFN